MTIPAGAIQQGAQQPAQGAPQVQQVVTTEPRAQYPASVALQMVEALRNPQSQQPTAIPSAQIPQAPVTFAGQAPTQMPGAQQVAIPTQQPPNPFQQPQQPQYPQYQQQPPVQPQQPIQQPVAQPQQQQYAQPVPQQQIPQPVPQPVIQPAPGIPQEWVGQPLSRLNALMAQRAQQQQFQAQQQQVQPQQLPSQGPPQQFQQPVAQPQIDTQFLRNPRAAIQEAVNTAVADAVQAITLPDQIRNARNAIASSVPNYGAIEAEVVGVLSNVSPQALADPNVWRNAAAMVLGQRALMQQLAPQPTQQPPVQQQPPQQSVQPGQIPGYNQLNAQQAWQPYQPPQTGQFFTESPNGQQQIVQPSVTPQQAEMARKMGVPVEAFAAFGNLQGGR